MSFGSGRAAVSLMRPQTHRTMSQPLKKCPKSTSTIPLPKHLIAQLPTNNRVDARLMVVDRAAGTVAHEHIRELPLLAAGDALVLNETKVLPARLVGRRRATGGHWEGLFLASDENRTWKLLCKARGKIFAGERIELVTDLGPGALDLELVAKEDSGA